MADENRILGDIRPRTSRTDEDLDKSMTGGSQHDRSEHSGSRDLTEGTTGGTGTEVGGTRNYRQGSRRGCDIGNRPVVMPLCNLQL
jgi:hypothetical protein